MRIILLGIIASFVLSTTAFAQSSSKLQHNAKKGKVTLRGKIGNLNAPAQLLLSIADQWDTIPVKNGEFNVTKEAMLPAYGALMIRYKPTGEGEGFFNNSNLQSMFFDEGVIELNSPVDTLKRYLSASGSGSGPFNSFMNFWKKEGELVREQRKLAAEFNKATPEQMQSAVYQKAYEEKNAVIEQKLKDMVVAQIKSDPSSLVSTIAFSGFQKRTEGSQSFDQLMEVFNLLSADYRNSEPGKELFEYMKSKSTDPAEEAAGNVVSGPATTGNFLDVGSIMPDFTQNDASGKPVKLSDYRGRYVLLDFWASWCVPCRSVNPQLVKMYNKYKSKNFDVLGISLDNSKSAWETAIMQDKLYWRHVSDLKGGDNAVAKQFKVDTIPMSFLLDPEGRILVKGHSLEAVEAALQQKLGK